MISRHQQDHRGRRPVALPLRMPSAHAGQGAALHSDDGDGARQVLDRTASR